MLDIMYYHSIIGGKLLKLDHSEDDHGKFGGDGRSDEPFQEESEDDESSNVSVSTSHGGDKESPSPFSRQNSSKCTQLEQVCFKICSCFFNQNLIKFLLLLSQLQFQSWF